MTRVPLLACMAALLSSSCPVAVCGLCPAGDVCVRDVDAGDHCAQPAARGELCSRRSDTPPDGELDHACALDLVCVPVNGSFVPTSICVPAAGPRLLDEPCGDAPCDDGLACADNFDVDVCMPGEGAPCTFSEDCASGACDGDQNCAPNECRDDSDCSFDDVCAGSDCGRRCEPPAAAGELCITRADVERCDEIRACAPGLSCASDPAVRADGVCQ